MLSSDNGRPSIRPSVCYAAHCTHAMFLQKNSHFISATLHIHPLFLPLLSCFTLLFYVSRRLLYLIFACRLAFVNLILRFKTPFAWQLCTFTRPFLPLMSCFNLLFCISRWHLCLIFACRSSFINLILRIKTSFSWQICVSTQPFYLQCCALTCFISLDATPILSTAFQVHHYLTHMARCTIRNWPSLFDDSVPTRAWSTLRIWCCQHVCLLCCNCTQLASSITAHAVA